MGVRYFGLVNVRIRHESDVCCFVLETRKKAFYFNLAASKKRIGEGMRFSVTHGPGCDGFVTVSQVQSLYTIKR